jgi:galactose mutarotase-like enzyme
MEYDISNSHMAVTVRPDLGGRIDQIIDKGTGKAWLWHPKTYRAEPRRLEIGASFDANWSGGWDEMFPNDAACQFLGRELPDHGELWSQAWSVTGQTESGITLEYECKTVPVRAAKGIALKEGSLEVRYRFENLSDDALPFLLKLHPALAIEPGDEIQLPACQIEPVELGFSTIIGRPGRTPFPLAYNRAGEEVRVDAIPSRSAMTREFFYATDLSEGWCAISHRRTGTRLALTFDTAAIPYVWVFQSFGGWNDHYVLMLEPCTNIPYDLEAAYKAKTCAVLGPREKREMVVGVRVGPAKG